MKLQEKIARELCAQFEYELPILEAWDNAPKWQREYWLKVASIALMVIRDEEDADVLVTKADAIKERDKLWQNWIKACGLFPIITYGVDALGDDDYTYSPRLDNPNRFCPDREVKE